MRYILQGFVFIPIFLPFFFDFVKLIFHNKPLSLFYFSYYTTKTSVFQEVLLKTVIYLLQLKTLNKKYKNDKMQNGGYKNDRNTKSKTRAKKICK